MLIFYDGLPITSKSLKIDYFDFLVPILLHVFE
jgi:hypothetical protein